MYQKRRIFMIILTSILTLFILSGTINAVEIEKGDYSKRYEEWLKLPEEERENTIAPLPFNIRNEKRNVFNIFRNILKATQIPEYYDLREHITVEVKNQMDTGECWAFSANSSIETYLALNGETYNFSERHLDYSTASNFLDGVNEYALNRLVGDGGYASTAFTYYSRGSGPINEEDMPFENNEYRISVNELPQNVTVKKVDNMIYFSNIYKFRENGVIKYVDADNNEYTQIEVNEIRNKVKEHIMKYGAVSTDVYAPSVYYNEETYADNLCENAYSNHAVTIIGWDDNYSKTNFINQPSKDGAYIVLNSWGTEWGENGVYYVSYEDFLIESQMRGVTEVSDIEYDNLYQYDISEMWNCIESQYAANVFTAKENELLTEIMIGSLSEQTCDIYINATSDDLNINNLTKIASDVKLKPGYNTINVDSNIALSSGCNFAIIVKLTSAGYTGVGIEDNNDVYFGNAKSNLGESFVSEDGINWTDIYNENNFMNLSIKAYTKTEKSCVEVIDIEYPNKLLFENLGGEVKVKLKTTKDYEGYQFNVLIHDELENDITSQFNIVTNEIKDAQGRVNISVPNTITSGNYSIKIFNQEKIVAEADFVVSEEEYDTKTYMKVKISDGNLYKALKNTVLSDFEIYAYFDDTQELIVRRDIETIDLEGTEIRPNGTVRFGSGYNVHDLTGIENFTNLKNLNLSGNPIEDLKPIENLTKLENLQLYYGLLAFSGIDYNNEIKNVDVVGNLTNLYRLDITNCKLEDISFLSNLYNLQSLDLQQNQISDISPLKNLTNIYYLNLGSNKIKRIDDLSNLTNLNTLILQDNLITDISVIGNLTNLRELLLNINQITDASLLDNELVYKDLSLDISNNYIYEDINIMGKDSIIKEVPEIIKQVLNEDSLLFSEEGVNLVNCEWHEYGVSIKINTENKLYSSCSIEVKSGSAIDTVYEISLSNGIRIKNAPTKTEYIEGENFDTTGMIVEIINENGVYEESANYTVINGTNLVEGQEYVIIRSVENPEIEIFQQITVIVDSIDEPDWGIEDLLPDASIEFLDNNLYNAIKNRLMEFGINFECYDDENRIVISRANINNITSLYLSNMNIENIIGIENFTKLQTIDLSYNSNLNNIDSLSLLPQIKRVILNSTAVEDIEKLINKESVEEIIINNINLNVYNNKEEIIELPKYIYQSLKLQEESIASAVIYYDILDTTRGSGGDFPINDYDNFEIVNINLDDEKEVATIELDRSITNQKKIGIRGILIKIHGGKISNSQYMCYYKVDKELTGISVNGYASNNYYFVEGQNFNSNGLQVVANYNDRSSQEITDYQIVDGENLRLGQESVTISYTENGITKITTHEITVTAKELTGIAVTKVPDDVNYIEGQNFDKTGMIVTATYNDGTSKEVTNYTVTDGNNLTVEKTSVTISYTENGVTKEATQGITVIAKELTGIAVTKAPDDVTYIEGQNFDKTGMVVTATYNDETSKEVTNYTVTDGNNLTVERTSVTISYTENGIIKTTTQGITVTEKLQIEIDEYTENKEENDSYIEDISPNTTIEDMISKIDTNGQIEIFKGTEKITDKNAKIATGMKIKITLNNEYIEYTAVVKGDLTGDGEMGDVDLLRMARYKAGLDKNLTGAYLKAADINNNNENADDIDLLKLVRILVGLDSF